MNRRTALGILTALLTIAGMSPAQAVDQKVIEAQQRRVRVIQQVASSVVAIFGNGGAGGGSGVVITPDGYALSNFHVTSGAGDFMKCGLNDGVLYDAVIVGAAALGNGRASLVEAGAGVWLIVARSRGTKASARIDPRKQNPILGGN